MHAVYMIQMLDTALNMLGPDIELLTEILLELGTKHERYGVKPEMFQTMGKSLEHMLEKIWDSTLTRPRDKLGKKPMLDFLKT